MNIQMLVLKIFLPFIFLVFGQMLFAQNDTLPNPQYGSAKELKGRNFIVNFFVSEGKRKWDMDEKNEILDMQNNGIAWLKAQAVKWKREEFSFRRSNIGLEKDIVLDKFESGKDLSKLNTNLVPMVLHAAGYESVSGFYDSVKEANQVDNVVVLVFANYTGRSYALPAYSNNKNNIRFFEGAIVYRTDYNNKFMYPSFIMHEMLHLFGAWDMYHTETRSPEMERKITDVFSQSIMLNSYQQLDDFKIDQMTAWLIGWSKRYWSYFEMFRQGNNQYWKTIPGVTQPTFQ